MSAPPPTPASPPTAPPSDVRVPPPAYDFDAKAAAASVDSTAIAPPNTAKITVGNTTTSNPADSTRPLAWQFSLTVDAVARPFVDRVEMTLHPKFFLPSVYTLTAADATADGAFRLPRFGWGVFEGMSPEALATASGIAVRVNWSTGGTSTIQHQLQFSHCEAFVSSMVPIPLDASPAPPPAPPPPPPVMQQQQQHAVYGRRSRGPRPKRPASDDAPVPKALPKIDLGKPKNDKHTVIAMVVDRSGSMQAMGSEVEGGCNTYLDEQRSADVEDAATTTVLLTTFDSTIERVVDGTPLSTMPPITHEQVAPRGMTAMYDGIGDTLVRTAQLVNEMETMPSIAVFILTDGAENSSRTWTKKTVSKEITRLQAEPYNWEFYFAAANQDAMAAGSSLGLESGKCMQWAYEPEKMQSAMRSANHAYQRQKRGVSKGEFSSAERMNCA